MDEFATQLAESWSFEPTEELPGGWCSKVYANQKFVLKVPFRGEEMSSGLVAAFQLSSHLGPKILEFDEATGSILMERILPGTSLAESELPDPIFIPILAGWIKQIRQFPTANLTTTRKYFQKICPMLEWLIETTSCEVFLHGDLHHYNILNCNQSGWKIIDPKGIVGDPNLEAIAYLRNPIQKLGDIDAIKIMINQRLALFETHLGFDPFRILCWAYLDLKLDEDNREFDAPWTRLQLAIEQICPELTTRFKF